MGGRILKLSHLLVRTIAIANLLIFGFTIASPRYSHAIANSRVGGFLVDWAIATALVLPIVVVLERIFKGRMTESGSAWWIDFGLTVSWCALLCGTVFYAFGHYGFP